jgi:hypothetical protein
VLFYFLIIGIAFAGPFGLDMGMTFDQVRDKTGNSPELTREDLYRVDPPNKHDMFESYFVQISPKYGIVWIRAIGKDIATNGHGTMLKSAFNDLVASIERTYGKYTKTDVLLPGSIWDEPEDFMIGLLRKDRYLMAGWNKDSGASLPNDISTIGVMISASSRSEGYVVLEYYSPNKDLVDAEKKAKQDSVF